MKRSALGVAIVIGGLAALWWLLSPAPRPAPPAGEAESEPAIVRGAPAETAAARRPLEEVEVRTGPPGSASAPESGPQARDPSFEELNALRRASAPGELHVAAVRGLTPIAGARVDVWIEEQAPESRDGATGSWNGLTDAAGEAFFRGLAPANRLVRVTTAEGEHREAKARERDAGYSVVIVFGSSCIEGTVHDGLGALAPGALVMTSQLGAHAGGDYRMTVVRADALARFRFCGLTAGKYWLIADPSGTRTRDAQQWLIDVETARPHVVTLGRPPTWAHWSGRVVDEEGRAVPGVHALRVSESSSGLERLVVVDDEGTFDEGLPSGEHRVQAQIEERTVAVAPISMEARDVDRDAVVLGARLELRVLYAGDARGPAGVPDDVTLSLTPGGIQSASFALARQSDDAFLAVGLAPGEYVLRTDGPYRFLGDDEFRMPFEIPAGRTSFALEVAVRHWQR